MSSMLSAYDDTGDLTLGGGVPDIALDGSETYPVDGGDGVDLFYRGARMDAGASTPAGGKPGGLFGGALGADLKDALDLYGRWNAIQAAGDARRTQGATPTPSNNTRSGTGPNAKTGAGTNGGGGAWWLWIVVGVVGLLVAALAWSKGAVLAIGLGAVAAVAAYFLMRWIFSGLLA